MSGIEYGLGGFGDSRLQKRRASLQAALVLQPGSCIRRLGGTRAREMLFTRLLCNRSVTAEKMSRHADALTGGRAAGLDVVAIQDISELGLGGRRAAAAGYGIVGKGGAARGLLLHPVLALLGLVSMQVWNRAEGVRAPRRQRETKAKESQRWRTAPVRPVRCCRRREASRRCRTARATSTSCSSAVPGTSS